MRELFEDAFGNEPLDPTESARRNMRPNLRKRFYDNASVGEGTPYPLLLDGRGVKTPAGRTLAAPSAALGEAIAAEWNAQGERIDPATMPLTRLANTIIDGVAPNPEPVAEEIAKYLGSDLRVLSRRYAGGARRRAGAAVGSRARLGARNAWRTLCAQRRRDVRGAAGGGGRRCSRRHSVRPMAARCGPPHHHADRIGADRACGRDAQAWHRRSVGRGARRRRLEHEALGPRRARTWRAAPPASPTCRRRGRCCRWPEQHSEAHRKRSGDDGARKVKPL